MEYLLNVQHLNKKYVNAKFQLLDINFFIEPNTVVGIIGKNGSGKSTLINTLVGNRFKDSGKISFFDNFSDSNVALYKENIGVVFDNLRMPNKLNIIQLNKVFNNIYKTWDSPKFFKFIEQFELPKTKKLSTFSRGMGMKLSLAIALSHDTKLLILDEMTAGMDVLGREEVIEVLEHFANNGNGILMSSHISEDMEKIAKKLIFMKDGKILLQEDKETLLTKYGIIELNENSLNMVKKSIIAYRKHNNVLYALISDKALFPHAKTVKSIDSVTKLLMGGEVL